VEKTKKKDSRAHRISQVGPNNPWTVGRSLTMPNPAKQLERHSWAAGYADGYIDGLEEAWARINAEIEGRPIPQPEKDEFRKGLLLACKLIAQNA
jgi:hypothetical protein